jgi:hypothetical protein
MEGHTCTLAATDTTAAKLIVRLTDYNYVTRGGKKLNFFSMHFISIT